MITKFQVGDIVDRKGNQPWHDKTGLIAAIKFEHGDPKYGVMWFGQPRMVFFEGRDLTPHQRAG
jgi:hypothetical protein